ncbi:hypothetical protein M408DRAFT_85594 [Serendipita vermifera MAFF 305830]|uniref:DNA mismatch repair proteins mutS family domain-containing protein n=1 Tax=Serendipita vermifera MAFF 305830 TaxID=933852 RepID=A0A0C3BQT3_SERVB|nr:hypothetical protein M408DRAFT_85594 [Serendipita vermifera MAFF 305830]
MLAARPIIFSTRVKPFLVRHFTSSLSRGASSSAGSDKKLGKTRTRKKRQDLPETLLSPSGRPLAPLSEWNGGLTGRSSKLAASTSKPSVEKTKKSRVSRKAKVSDEKGALPIERRPDTELALEIYKNLERFPHCLLLTRVGQFYESYFEQAAELAKALNIKLTSKSWGGQKVDMCGFPLGHLDKHLKVLIRNHRRCVALCEEFKLEGGKFERRVTRVITPGTLIDEAFVNPYENNYILSVGCPVEAVDADTPVGLAWMDVSTGEFFSQKTTLGSLRDEVVRIGPREVVLQEGLRHDDQHPIRLQLAEDATIFQSFVSANVAPLNPMEATERPNSDDVTRVDPILPEYGAEEASAITQLTKFLTENLLEHMPALSQPLQQGAEERMQIDAHTIKSLEIKEGMREGGVTGTLLSVINRTQTTSGSRLLSRWVHSPSTSVSEITTRQTIVAFFKARTHLRADLITILRKIEDTARIVQKFLAGRGAPDDLRKIGAAISHWETFRTRLELERKMEVVEQGALIEWECMDKLLSKMVSLQGLSEKISGAISSYEEYGLAEQEEAEGEEDLLDPMVASSGSKNVAPGSLKWHIKPEFSPALKRLHVKLEKLQRDREDLQLALQAKYSASTLTLKAGTHLGYHIHVKKRDASKLSSLTDFVALSESTSTKSFFNEAWFRLGSSITETSDQIMEMEREAFIELREDVTKQSSNLRRNARITDELDVMIGFAELAVEMSLVRPVVTDGLDYHIVNGRHPTVELGLLRRGRLFTPNHVSLEPSAPLHIITGPNMAGKSTLLRQTALIAVLAQTGSFVPADYARIGVIDRLFSRVGAKDDLFRDRSTFMVEMLETAEILHRATPRSLVIMDEVGRGTAVTTAVALAFASVQHLYTVNQCRALFATHFHEVADMLGYNEETRQADGFFDRVAFYCTDVDELEKGTFTYSHRLRPGVNRDSHGLKVAQLARMPQSAIKVAEAALEHFIGEDKTTWLARAEDFRALGKRLATLS